jgi:hypothetical protein
MTSARRRRILAGLLVAMLVLIIGWMLVAAFIWALVTL